MDFLVQMEVMAQVGDELLRKEAERARELARAGILQRLWRVPGRRANWGLWAAATTDELHAALASLPLYPYLDITVHPLATHPNDPGSLGGPGWVPET
ncbi:MAG TPA: muconolactone Delta-isomerase family protein [Bryobacteraceae bacterium]|jgi:muconolactone delta-isomerase